MTNFFLYLFLIIIWNRQKLNEIICFYQKKVIKEVLLDHLIQSQIYLSLFLYEMAEMYSIFNPIFICQIFLALIKFFHFVRICLKNCFMNIEYFNENYFSQIEYSFAIYSLCYLVNLTVLRFICLAYAHSYHKLEFLVEIQILKLYFE